jgi:hypothetical protein
VYYTAPVLVYKTKFGFRLTKAKDDLKVRRKENAVLRDRLEAELTKNKIQALFQVNSFFINLSIRYRYLLAEIVGFSFGGLELRKLLPISCSTFVDGNFILYI